ncbi:MAG: META domain-containing protein [Methanoculleus sp.]
MAPNRRKNRNYILATASLLVIVVASIIAAGCMGSTTTPEAPVMLPGTSWTLASLAGEDGAMIPVLAGANVTATFSLDRNVGGNAGCNQYGAGYTVDGANLTIEPAIRTEMYCNEPPGIMAQEDRYLALLAQVASYRTEEGRLILADSEGADLLVFEKAVPMPDLPLTGTDWVLETYNANNTVSSVIAGTTVTVTFAPDGNVTGNAGCNHYGGQYSLDGGNLAISSLFSTLMYCETPGVMEQESAYLTLLANVTSFRVEGDRLTLTDADGTDLLFFVQAPEVPPAPLVGTEWMLESYSSSNESVSSVIAGTTVTATFSPEGKVTGNAGCNSYGADYVLDGAKMTISPPISTKMYCGEPEGVMAQENTYLNLLPSVSSYRVEGNRLVLSDATGADLLFFVQAPLDEGRWASPPPGAQYDLLDEDGNIIGSL